MNETLRKSSVISLNTPEATLKAIESIQKSIDSFKCENMFPNLMTLSKSLDCLKASYSFVSSSPNQEETVSNEARDAANEIVDKIETDPVFNNCTFNINVPERSNKWTRSEILSLIQLIIALIALVAGCIHSPSEESNVADNFTQEVNQLIIDTNKLANLSVDSVDLIHLDEAAQSK